MDKNRSKLIDVVWYYLNCKAYKVLFAWSRHS